jgi:hypothetical protein
MLEFNIQPTKGGWFNYPAGSDCRVFQPPGLPSRILSGRDVCYIEVEGCEVSFSDEMHGVHVVFESGSISPERALEIVEAIAKEVHAVTGQAAVVYES